MITSIHVTDLYHLRKRLLFESFNKKMNTIITVGIEAKTKGDGLATAPVNKIGYWAAILSILFGLGYVLAQLLSWVKIISYPNDLFWLFLPSLFLGPAFLVTMICLHYRAPLQVKIWSSIGTAFSIIYCTMATLTYFTQLGSIVPGLLSGEINETHPLIFKPRSFTMSIDCLGYFFMSLSTLFTAFAFRETEKKLYGWMLFNGLLIFLFIPAYFNPFLYYIGSVWAVSFSMCMIYTAKFMRSGNLFVDGRLVKQ